MPTYTIYYFAQVDGEWGWYSFPNSGGWTVLANAIMDAEATLPSRQFGMRAAAVLEDRTFAVRWQSPFDQPVKRQEIAT